jgi:hypothetical protein
VELAIIAETALKDICPAKLTGEANNALFASLCKQQLESVAKMCAVRLAARELNRSTFNKGCLTVTLFLVGCFRLIHRMRRNVVPSVVCSVVTSGKRVPPQAIFA